MDFTCYIGITILFTTTPQAKPEILLNTNLNVGNGTGLAVGALVVIGLSGAMVVVIAELE